MTAKSASTPSMSQSIPLLSPTRGEYAITQKINAPLAAGSSHPQCDALILPQIDVQCLPGDVDGEHVDQPIGGQVRCKRHMVWRHVANRRERLWIRCVELAQALAHQPFHLIVDRGHVDTPLRICSCFARSVSTTFAIIT